MSLPEKILCLAMALTVGSVGVGVLWVLLNYDACEEKCRLIRGDVTCEVIHGTE